MLSKCFDVSIDYLVGKTDCIHPEYEETHETTGLSEDSIQTLKLKKKLLDKPIYTQISPSFLGEDGCLDVTKLPDSKEKMRYYFNNSSFQYNECGKTKTISKNDIIAKINNIIDQFPQILNPEGNKILDNDDVLIVEEKFKQFQSHCPNKHFFDALNKLITYKDGLIINLLSDYLFPNDMKIMEPFEASSGDDFLMGEGNPFSPLNQYDNIPLETLFLYQLQSELVMMKKDNDTL